MFAATLSFSRTVLAACALAAGTAFAHAAEWFEPLTLERVIAIPAAEQRPWLEYLARSQKHLLEEKNFRAAEARAAGVPELKLAPYGTVFGVNLDRPVEWFSTDEGRRITTILLSFQTPTGGWSKRIDLSKAPRAPGMDFVTEHNGHYEGTFDNDATTTQLRAIARAFKATGNEEARASFLRGLNYIFISQYPNGGWPQIYPLETGYHDAITYNDDVMVNILTILAQIAEGRDEFDFVPQELRDEARAREARGREVILKSQIRVRGELTGWCQQHDMLTLAPCAARNFEPAGICSAESASVLAYLIKLPNPSAETIAAIEGVAGWLQKSALTGFAWRNVEDKGRLLVAAPGAGPIWARLYEIETNRPIFGNPDRTIHYDVSEITRERRNGYSWYGSGPARALEQYRAWKAQRQG